jgi:hypothetical protein
VPHNTRFSVNKFISPIYIKSVFVSLGFVSRNLCLFSRKTYRNLKSPIIFKVIREFFFIYLFIFVLFSISFCLVL